MPQQDQMNKDLRLERQKATFNGHEFSVWWAGGEEKYKERKALERIFLEDPELKDEMPMSYLSHKEQYEESVRKSVRIAQKIRELRSNGEDSVDTYNALLGASLGSALIKEGNPMTLHFVMFVPTIMGQGTIEQQIKWLEKAWDFSIIGTYAQTELGHGTFLRGLETRADYDEKTQEFVLNTPTLTAYKWWPGGLGHTANYAVVVAQLYTLGKFRGLAPFIVQLRDENTHKPMPGVDVGEIGTKLGMKTMNNGFLGLKNVRIPLNQMLMKNQQVLPDGTFVPPKATVLTYATMMFVRVAIIRDSCLSLAKASTIATRYSAVRRQSPIIQNEPEPQIMDHVTQQLKIFPQIAKAIVFKCVGDYVWNMYNQIASEVESGKMGQLPEMHALSCCLKAICSNDAAVGVEICRLSCGGHGFMDCSNFPTLYGMATAACTYEGENTVMLLQTARHLIKVYGQVINSDNHSKLVPTVLYIRKALERQQFGPFQPDPESIVDAFQFVAANKIRIAYERMEEQRQRGICPEMSANLCGIELTQAADLHGRAFMATSACNELQSLSRKVSKPLANILQVLLELYLIDACLNRIGDFLRFISLTAKEIETLELRLQSCLQQLRPNAVSLVDAFEFHDRVLNSALGTYDGNVYEQIFKAAKMSPLNKESVNVSFHKNLKPFMKSHL